MKIINAQAVSEKMTEEETKNFLANNANNLLMRIGTIDGKGEPNVTVTAFYFDEPSEKIFVVTQKDSKKVQHLKNRNIISYCIDDPNPRTQVQEVKEQSNFLQIFKKIFH